MNFHRMLTTSCVRRLSFSLETISHLVKFARSQGISMACITHVGLFYRLQSLKSQGKSRCVYLAETKHDKGLSKLGISVEV